MEHIKLRWKLLQEKQFEETNHYVDGGSKKYSPNLERLDLWAPVFQSEMLNRWKGLPLYVNWFIYFQ